MDTAQARRAEDAAQQMQMHLTLTVKKLAKVEQAQAQLERDSAAQVRELHARCQLLEDRLRMKDTLPVSSKQLEQLEGKVGEFAKTFGSPQAAIAPTACPALAEQNREGGLSQDVLNRLQKQKEELLRQTSGRAPAVDGSQDCGDSGGEDRQCSGAQAREQRGRTCCFCHFLACSCSRAFQPRDEHLPLSEFPLPIKRMQSSSRVAASAKKSEFKNT